jgi:DUF1365 family protein
VRSHLLEGTVRHRRARPFTYGLEHSVWYAALDVDEIEQLDGRLRLFGRNRRAVATFRDADHLPDPARTSRRTSARTPVRGEDPSGGSRQTNLRVLGYVFNPASPLCRDEPAHCGSS